jgi:hypothetical protein
MNDATETLLSLPLGTPGAGRIRYGAAMALYQQGRLSPAELEAWRFAAASDNRPVDHVLAAYGLPAPDPASARQSAPLARLMDEAATYLAPLRCPGAGELRRLLARRTVTPLPMQPCTLPVVTTHLPAAVEVLATTHPALAAAILSASHALRWTTYDSYPADQIGPTFAANHAFCSLMGRDAPFPAQDADFGIFLIAPDILYRDHSHAAPELYLPLTGPHGWRFGPNRPLQIKPAHHPIWNDPHRPHLTKVGRTPFLAFYGWTREAEAPARILPADDWPKLEALRLTVTP